MRRIVCVTAIAAVFFTLPAGRADAASASGNRLQALARAMTFGWAKRHPLFATSVGLTERDGDLDSPSAAANAADLAQIRSWERALGAIPAGSALVDRDDARLLRAQLVSMERVYTEYRPYEKDYSAPAQAIVSTLFTQFVHLPTGDTEAENAERSTAWRKIVERMQKAPAYIRTGQGLVSHPGHLQGLVGAQQLEGAPDFFSGALTAAAQVQLAHARFDEFVAARGALLATISATKKYIAAHVARWPENYAIGRTAYDAMLRDEQLIPYDTVQIAQMGADELGHGWAEQIWAEHDAAVAKTPVGPETGGGMAPSGEAIVAYYSDLLAQLTDFLKTHDVVTIPAWIGDVKVVETPKFLQPVQPGASMDAPRTFSKETTGIYFITPPKSLAAAAKRLDLNQDFDRDRIWSTAAHETFPGHYLQLSIARRHPDFVRKIAGSGVFAEGWAYYGEEMFVRLGLYGSDLDARVEVAQWERVRGVRAIVDIKLATGEWSYRRASDFFAAETGAPKDQADAAVAGIALGPGYVISYTVGRLQLQNLLTEYRRRTGTKGSLRDFHDRLLSYGTVPFAIVAPELLADLTKPVEQVRAAARF